MLSNAIEWFKKLEKKFPEGFNNLKPKKQKLLQKEVFDNLVTILPNTMTTGFDSIDDKIRMQNKPQKSALKIGKLMKNDLKFVNYTDEKEVPDLNVLYTGATQN